MTPKGTFTVEANLTAEQAERINRASRKATLGRVEALLDRAAANVEARLELNALANHARNVGSINAQRLG